MSSDSEIGQKGVGHHAISFKINSTYSSESNTSTVDCSTGSPLKDLTPCPSSSSSSLVGSRGERRGTSDTFVGQQVVSLRAIWSQRKHLLALGRRRFASRSLDRSEPGRDVLPMTIDERLNVQILMTNLTDTQRDLGMSVSARHNVKEFCRVQESCGMLRHGGAVKITVSSEEARRSCETRHREGSAADANGYWCGGKGCTGYKSKGRLYISEDDEVPAEDRCRNYITPTRDMVYQKRLPGTINSNVIDISPGVDTGIPRLTSTSSTVKALTSKSTRVTTTMSNKVSDTSNRSSFSQSGNHTSGTEKSSANRRTTKKKTRTRNNLIMYNRNLETSSPPPPSPGPAPMRPLPSLPIEANQNASSGLIKAKFLRSNMTEDRRNHGVEVRKIVSSSEVSVSSSSPTSPSLCIEEQKVISRWTTEELRKTRKDRKEKVRIRKMRDMQVMQTSTIAKTENERMKKDPTKGVSVDPTRLIDNVMSGSEIRSEDSFTSRYFNCREGASVRRSSRRAASFQSTEKYTTCNSTSTTVISPPKPKAKLKTPSSHLSSSSPAVESELSSNQRIAAETMTISKELSSSSCSSSSSSSSISCSPSTTSPPSLLTTPLMSISTTQTSTTTTRTRCPSCHHPLINKEKEKAEEGGQNKEKEKEMKARLQHLERKNAELERYLTRILHARTRMSSSSSASSSSSIESVETAILHPTPTTTTTTTNNTTVGIKP